MSCIRDLSAEAADRRRRGAGFLDRLGRIEPSRLAAADRVNYGILGVLLSESVEEKGFGQRT